MILDDLKKSKDIIDIIKRMIRDGDIVELKLEELINELSDLYVKITKNKKEVTTFDEILPGVRDEGFHARQKSEPGYYIFYDLYTNKLMEKDIRNSIYREYTLTSKDALAKDWEFLNKKEKMYFVLLECTDGNRKLSEKPYKDLKSALEVYKNSRFKVLKLIDIPELNQNIDD